MKSAVLAVTLLFYCTSHATAAPLAVTVHPLPVAATPAPIQPVFIQPVQQEPVYVTRDCGAAVGDVMQRAEIKLQSAGRTLGGALR